jgi:hypothetical protein
MKLVYIAHRIGGDYNKNIESVLELCGKLHTEDVLPFAPYIVALQYLDDTKVEEREKGMRANEYFFKNHIIDEILLCGPRISKGMEHEIKLALKYEIPITCHNPELQKGLDELIAKYKPLSFKERMYCGLLEYVAPYANAISRTIG